ncbi:hybrid non-ribosomal peptide synthetase/type I polyketide synthase [Terriglobus roseus]|uniref:Amino acid adenylation domain-containing protein n=1 Tax=Terriglobus roseus TaxID=392734 RepID=A0A1H4SI40_9BACT|nr:hybrid non-ribosomal peptide synthetase/type I polyketide synthase [Terriglobus roseus]SEC43852.1 amino acid adenylation domain-containing protein [Terriglobus roseus]
MRHTFTENDIAIIGMGGRFPGANDVESFWQNLMDGIDTVTRLSAEEIDSSIPLADRTASNYVRSRGLIDHAIDFDADLFRFLPREAEVTDPQQRVLMEVVWSALENSGYAPRTHSQRIGLCVGCSINTYMLGVLSNDPTFLTNMVHRYQVGSFSELVGNGQDFLATRIGYKLGFTGPVMTVQSACSTSLLAVAQACDILRADQADMAVAGGVSVTFPERRGYAHDPGGIVSSDGHCRPFDAEASGTVFGSGAAVVVLKKALNAIRDGDHIVAVIRGVGISNDGSERMGFAAPCATGQSAAISMALRDAEVTASQVGYIECHGTGTPLGDPIEISGLNAAFEGAERQGEPCVLGSVKGNVGHLDVAAGVTGLIKAALTLEREAIPGTKYFSKPNANLPLNPRQFVFDGQPRTWKRNGTPRYAGVSAFGLGGTNVHLVLREALPVTDTPSLRTSEVLVISGATEKAARETWLAVQQAIATSERCTMPHAAFTLACGRERLSKRLAVTASWADEGGWTFAESAIKASSSSHPPKVAFLFPGQGAQHPGMGSGLYRSQPLYRNIVNECAEFLEPIVGVDMRKFLLGERTDEALAEQLRMTKYSQPALFIVAYAMARLWIHWGVLPARMVGHSLGELVAACLAGVIPLQDALYAVAQRGALMDSRPTGEMLAVMARLEQVQDVIATLAGLDIAAINAPNAIVIAGSPDDIAAARLQFSNLDIQSQSLKTSHAFHSRAMDAVMEPLETLFAVFTLRAPEVPIISTVTGQQLTAAQAMSPRYWAEHCRHTVDFAGAVRTLRETEPEMVFIECGAGNILTSLMRRQMPSSASIFPSLPSPLSTTQDDQAIATTVGAVWSAGVEIDWPRFYENDNPTRIPLPGYSFQRRQFIATSQATPAITPILQVPIPLQETVNMSTPACLPRTNARAEKLSRQIADILTELAGVDLSEDNEDTSFLELGLDSLFLTQLATKLQRTFAVDISFRDLLNDLSSIAALAQHLDATLPAEPTPAPTRPPAEVAVSAGSGSGASLKDLVQQQLLAMNALFQQQLSALSQMDGDAAPAPANAPDTAAINTADTPIVDIALRSSPRFRKTPPTDAGPEETPEQKAFVASLIAGYSTKTAGSKQHTQQFRTVHADPRNMTGFRKEWKEISYPLVVGHAKGSRLWDVDGNEYIDFVNGFGPTMFGHSPDFVLKAVQEQLADSIAIGPQTPLAGPTAELVSELTGMERVTFCNTGSEAVMAAMRLARTVTGRDKVMFFAGDYHGQFDEVLVRGLIRNGQPVTLPSAPGIPTNNLSNIVVFDYGDPEALLYLKEHADEMAAVIVEPVQSRHPDLQPFEFLHNLRAITKRTKIALVFDEVVTGFRLHAGGAQAHFGIRADMASYGKVAGGGMPIGILAGSPRFMDALDGGAWTFGDDSLPEAGMTFFAGTFVRHPLAIAATKATLEHIRDGGDELYSTINANADWFVQQAAQLFHDLDVPFTMEHLGSVMYLAIPAEIRSSGLLFVLLRHRGIYALEHFPLYLTTEHSSQDLQLFLDALRDSIVDLQRVGLLPSSHSTLPQGPDIAPLTDAQMEVLMAAQASDAANCVFNESCRVTLAGVCDEEKLKAAWKQLCLRHPAMRAVLQRNQPMMEVLGATSADLAVIDLQDVSNPNEAVARFIATDAETPFDLYNGPLVRACLLRTDKDASTLVLTAHHIVCDGWSTNVMLSDLGELYTAAVEMRAPDLPVAASFLDYAQEKAAQAPSDKKDLTFWREQLTSIPELPNLPQQKMPLAERTYRGNTLFVQCPSQLTQQLRRMGAAVGCTLFSTLFSAWALVLMKLSGQDELAVLIPAAQQASLPNGEMIGHCVHLLPIITRTSSEEKLSSYMVGTKRQILNAYDHQEVTYGTMVHELGIPRQAGRLPISELQFNLEKMGSLSSFKTLQASARANAKAFVNFDLFLNIVEAPEGLRLECDYNSDRYTEDQVGNWMQAYQHLLQSFLEHSDGVVADTSLATTEAFPLALRSNGAGIAGQSVLEWIDRQTGATPGVPAIEFYGRKLTYAELKRRSMAIATRLREAGIGSGDYVALLLDRSPDMISALLGVMRSGATYIPLDPSMPMDRTKAITQSLPISCVITSEEHAQVPQELALPKLLISSITDSDAPNPTALPGAADVAYVIFTSGSTGKPKGVSITHGNLLNSIAGIAEVVHCTADTRLMAVTTISFDIAAMELLMPLMYGGTVVIASRADAADGARLSRMLHAAKINMMQATPSTWRMLADANIPQPTLSMICGGEAWDRALADRLHVLGGRLWNFYGPTETTIWSGYQEVLPGDRPVSISHALPRQSLYVLDQHLRPLPVGLPGELCIGGLSVGLGYFGDPARTKDRFVPDHFAPSSAAHLYRTGDRATLTAEGCIQFAGRMDDQFKLRGFRIEPGEIEAALRTMPAVEQAVVVLRADTLGNDRLVAFLKVRESEHLLSEEVLQERLSQLLPDYMVPAFFVTLARLPLTANGKIDRKSLPGLEIVPKPDVFTVPPPPRSKDEAVLAKICAETLGLDDVDIDRSLFAVGADSLHIFQIASKGSKAGLPITARHLMKLKSIRNVCAALSVAAADTASSSHHVPAEVLAAQPGSGMHFGGQF